MAKPPLNLKTQRPSAWNADTPKSRAYEHIVADMTALLTPLDTADRTRVLLALHALIADHLDALSTTTHS